MAVQAVCISASVVVDRQLKPFAAQGVQKGAPALPRANEVLELPIPHQRSAGRVCSPAKCHQNSAILLKDSVLHTGGLVEILAGQKAGECRSAAACHRCFLVEVKDRLMTAGTYRIRVC